MREALCGRLSRWHWSGVVMLLALGVVMWGAPASATFRYGPLQLSGNLETQNLIRHSSPTKFQFVQNRNTVRIRVDWDWLKNGRWLDKFNVPFISHSKFYMLYRGVYDGFYDLAPTGNQAGQERMDDIVGGPIAGNDVIPTPANSTAPLQPGLYSRFNHQMRSGVKFENVLREAYVDLQLADVPVSFRIGRQQVIWGETDQFRLMDIWNPLDVTWHFQQESWDNIRVPLWLIKGLWDMGQVGPLSNSFLEVVYNPFDFQPNAKLAFLPRPWSVPFANPLRQGQIQNLFGGYISPHFNLQGTSFRRGDFQRNPQDASEVGLRFHGITPQGLEFTADYIYARGRGVGANTPLGVQIEKVCTSKSTPGCNAAALGDRFPYLGTPVGTFTLGNMPVTVRDAEVLAKIKYPYNHIFGLTGNYFDADYTNAVIRFETAYVMGEPEQSVAASDKLDPASPLGYTKRDIWAGMIGFDRPTWIRWLNPRATWFLTGQFFWNYTTGNVGVLRGNSGAAETPYYTPASGAGSDTNGVGVWTSGPYTGTVERLQNASADPSGDNIHRWEHLVTFAATSFYRGGTIVPFVANAWDPVDDNYEFLWNVDYYYSNNFIISLQQKLFTTYGSKAPSNDPWFAAGRFDRRDETGVKLTYQF